MPTPPPDLHAVIGSLPSDHVAALRAVLDGGRADEVAERVGVPVEALVPLLRLAAAKLDHALARVMPAPDPGARRSVDR